MPRGAPYRAQCRQYPIWLIHCSTFLSSGTADAQSHVQTHGGTVAASAFRGGAIADTDPRNYVHDPLRSLLNIAVGQFTKLITGDSDVPLPVPEPRPRQASPSCCSASRTAARVFIRSAKADSGSGRSSPFIRPHRSITYR